MNLLSVMDELEERLRQAMLQGDVEALNGLIDDELMFTGPDGAVYDKQMDLAAHRSGAIRMRELSPSERQMREIGEGAVVVSVKMHLVGEAAGSPFSGDYRYTRVWVRRDGHWRVLAGHCSPLGAS